MSLRLQWPEFGYSIEAMPDKSENLVQIERDNLILGVLPVSEAIELLEVGFLQAGDWWRPNEDLTGARRPLSEMRNASTGELDTVTTTGVAGGISSMTTGGSWLVRARQTVTTAAESIANSVGDVAGRLKSLGSLADQAPATISTATARLLEGYLPQIGGLAQGVMKSSTVCSLAAGVRDDVLMRKVFGAVYDLLPRPVCRFVSEERFIDFCLTHRSRLVGVNMNADTGR